MRWTDLFFNIRMERKKGKLRISVTIPLFKLRVDVDIVMQPGKRQHKQNMETTILHDFIIKRDLL